MEQTARGRLELRRRVLLAQLDTARNVLVLAAIFNSLVWLALGSIWALASVVPERWQVDNGPMICMLVWIALVLACLWLVAVLERHGRERSWQRHYAFISELLRTSDAGQLILQPERWERVHELLDDYPWLKLGALSRPHDLDAQVEFAADHWRALSALTRDQHGLRRAVFWGALTRLGDEVMVFLCNGCVIWFVLVIGAPFMYAGYVLFFPLTLWYVQNQAAQVALIDFLLE